MSHSALTVLLGLAGQSTALPKPSACWRGHPAPRHSAQGSSFGTSHGEVPRCGLGWALSEGHLPSKPPCLIRGLCASDGWFKVGFLGYPIPLVLPMEDHKKPCGSLLFPIGAGSDPKSPVLFPPLSPLSP